MSVRERRPFYHQSHITGNYLIEEAIRGQLMADVHIGMDGIYKATCNGILGNLMPVKGPEGILFTWSQGKIGWSQNSFITAVGFTLTLDKTHGTREEFTVKLTSEIILKQGQFSLITEG